jgi:PilZ domain
MGMQGSKVSLGKVHAAGPGEFLAGEFSLMKNQIRRAHGGRGTSGGENSKGVAEAQVMEITSGVRLSARSCDLVLHGCYVDTLRPFPVGTLVRIRLMKDGTAIEVNGNVVYQLPGLGMGIAFHDLSPESHAAMDKWLSHSEVRGESIEALLPPIVVAPPPVNQQQPVTEFVELVQLLIRKGILTKAEASRFLQEPLGE